MVGGTIVDIVKVARDKWWVNCVEKFSHSPQQCAIYLDPADMPLEVGDSLWWQGRSAFWTPASRACSDIELGKIGFSGVPHPNAPRCQVCGYTIEFCQKNGGCASVERTRPQGER